MQATWTAIWMTPLGMATTAPPCQRHLEPGSHRMLDVVGGGDVIPERLLAGRVITRQQRVGTAVGDPRSDRAVVPTCRGTRFSLL